MHQAFTDEAIEILTTKKNIRLLTVDFEAKTKPERKLTSIEGGALFKIVTHIA